MEPDPAPPTHRPPDPEWSTPPAAPTTPVSGSPWAPEPDRPVPPVPAPPVAIGGAYAQPFPPPATPPGPASSHPPLWDQVAPVQPQANPAVGSGGPYGWTPTQPGWQPLSEPSAPPARSGGGRRVAWVLLTSVAVFASGLGGVLVGRELADEPAPDRSAAPVTPTTPAAPVPPDAAEPIAAVAASLSPAVVQIETTTGLGSGFVYEADGLILTAAHVVDGSRTVTARFADGTSVQGSVLGTDPNTDVAVVRVEGVDDLAVAPLALGVDLQVGQTAVAIGSPFGLDQSVTAGIVSAVGRATETPGRDGVPRAIPAIQTDAPINSGNSGGALADSRGRVIGINSSIITADVNSGGNVGVGFAVPIDIAKAVADRIVAGQSVNSGYLGVSSADVTDATTGAELRQVEAGSPADLAGLEAGDIVVEFDGSQISSAIDLVAAVTPREPGEVVLLSVVRNGRTDDVKVTLGESPG